jgi:tetratricopeptide (TPR) repeat protein
LIGPRPPRSDPGRRHEEASGHFAKALQLNPRFAYLYIVQTTALALAGRDDEAKATAKRLLEVQAGFQSGPFLGFAAFANPELVAALTTGLRAAGLPA